MKKGNVKESSRFKGRRLGRRLWSTVKRLRGTPFEICEVRAPEFFQRKNTVNKGRNGVLCFPAGPDEDYLGEELDSVFHELTAKTAGMNVDLCLGKTITLRSSATTIGFLPFPNSRRDFYKSLYKILGISAKTSKAPIMSFEREVREGLSYDAHLNRYIKSFNIEKFETSEHLSENQLRDLVDHAQLETILTLKSKGVYTWSSCEGHHSPWTDLYLGYLGFRGVKKDLVLEFMRLSADLAGSEPNWYCTFEKFGDFERSIFYFHHSKDEHENCIHAIQEAAKKLSV